MEYRFLGKTGVKVSNLCFGTLTFGKEADRPTSQALFNRCRDVGINFFDCANTYAGGKSEELLGEFIHDIRHEVVITSKVYFPTSADVNARGASRKNIMQAVDASLKRLNTDFLDIYFLHRFDDFTSLPETLRAMDDLVRQGKVLYIGASNFAAWQVEKALGISLNAGWAPIEVLQPMYNLVKRQAEVEILPMAQSEKLGVITYIPLAGGYLSGKYSSTTMPESGRLVTNKMYATRYGADWMGSAVDVFNARAQELGVHPASLAVAWVGSHPAITAPIIGARNLEQLESSLASVNINMTPELRRSLSDLTPEPPSATDRSEEKTSFNYTATLEKK